MLGVVVQVCGIGQNVPVKSKRTHEFFLLQELICALGGKKPTSSRMLDLEKYMALTEISEEQCTCISRHYVLYTVILQ
jgi:hypothetical protein